MNDEDTALALRLGRKLRRLRTMRDWTQAHLAEAAEMSVNHVGYLERGERLPSVPMLVKLARSLGTNTDELLGEEEPSDPLSAQLVVLFNTLPLERKQTALVVLRGLAGERRATPTEASDEPDAKNPNLTVRNTSKSEEL